jgi:hypothetical protein
VPPPPIAPPPPPPVAAACNAAGTIYGPYNNPTCSTAGTRRRVRLQNGFYYIDINCVIIPPDGWYFTSSDFDGPGTAAVYMDGGQITSTLFC